MNIYTYEYTPEQGNDSLSTLLLIDGMHVCHFPLGEGQELVYSSEVNRFTLKSLLIINNYSPKAK